ncbi:MAG: hypothetical protein NTW21_00225 [Verrucomicrobia bacterium]|nr:hypothetical protein [Verrucomicrobiota bacterium]
MTYDQYYKRFASHFGSTITMNFFDDINIRELSYRNWTPDFNNFLLPSSMWYDPRKVWIPPLISHFSDEVGPELAKYNEWAARARLLLQGGRHVADIQL